MSRAGALTPVGRPARGWTRVALAALGLGVVAHLGYSLAYVGHNLAFGGGGFEEDFEASGLDGWTRHGGLELCCAHSAGFVSDPDGRGRVLKFELRADDPDVRGSKRAELRLGSAPFGEERWYAVRLRVPADWQSAPELVTVLQWHAVDDKVVGEGGRAPPLRLVADGDRWRIVSHWDPRPLTGWPFTRGVPSGGEVLWDGPLDRGAWTDWLFRVIWAYDGTGRLEVWKNGTALVRRSGPNAYNDLLAPYFKVGLYVPHWKNRKPAPPADRRELLVDSVRQGASDPRLAAAP